MKSSPIFVFLFVLCINCGHEPAFDPDPLLVDMYCDPVAVL